MELYVIKIKVYKITSFNVQKYSQLYKPKESRPTIFLPHPEPPVDVESRFQSACPTNAADQ